MSTTATRPVAAAAANAAPAIPVKEFFTLDVRALALWRVALGVLVFLDWVDRWPDVRRLFSDEGLLPRGAITGIQPISAFMLNGSPWFTAALFLIAQVFSVMLLVGWKTPLATIVSWFFLVSAHARNPPLMTGGDHLLRAMLLWGTFLPLGACWSVDSSRPGARPASPRVFSAASVAYLAQICIVYLFAAAWKWLGPWREEGTAVYLTLSIEQLATRFGLFLKGYPDVCWWLTHGTIWLESLGPAVLFLPFNVPLQRMIVIPAFILFHAGLALSIELGHFAFVCMVAWLPLLPTEFWDRLWSQMRVPEAARLTIAYDPDRPGASRLLAYLRTFLFLGESALVPASEEDGLLARARARGGWLVVDGEGKEHGGAEALRLLFRLSPAWSSLEFLVKGRFGRWLAGFIGRGPRAARPAAERGVPAWKPPGGAVINAVVIFLICYIFLCNGLAFASGILRDQYPEQARRWLPLAPDQLWQLGSATGIDQGWGLFAPEPGRRFGWYVVVGTKKDGSMFDLLTGHRVSETEGWEKPKFLTSTFESARWRKLFMNLAEVRNYPYLLPNFSRYYFEQWNRQHTGDDQLRLIQVYWMRDVTLPPGVPSSPVERVQLSWYAGVPESEAPSWLVLAGVQKDGARFDLLRGGVGLDPEPVKQPHPIVDPPIVSPFYPFLVTILTSDARKHLLPGYTQYMLEEWNRTHREQEHVVALELIRLEEDRGGGPAKQQVLSRYEVPKGK